MAPGRWLSVLLGALGLLVLTGRAKAPDWLDPCLAPAAAAWHKQDSAVMLLDREEARFLTPQRVSYHVQGAIRANTASGCDRLRVQLGYNPDYMKVESVRAWIVAPTGKVTGVARREFLDSVATVDARFWDNRRMLSYDASGNTEAGSVLAWEYVLEAPADFLVTGWEIGTGLALWRGSFEASPAPGCVLTWHRRSPLIPEPAAGQSSGSLVWRLERLAPLLGGRPTGFQAQPVGVDVRCVPAGSPAEDGPAGWARVASTVNAIIEPRAQVTPAVQACADETVQGRAGRWDRIRALTEFVQKKIVYLALTLDKDSLAGYRPHPAGDVLRDRLGDCKDKATLLVALLRAIGERSHVILVHARSPLAVDPAWPGPQFDHAIVGIPADADTPAWWPVADFGTAGRLVLFDPTDPDLPLGCLPVSDQNGRVLAVMAAGGALAETPGDPADYAGWSRTTTVALTADGDARIECEERTQGTPGSAQEQRRQMLGAQRFGQELERRLRAGKTDIHDLTWTATWDPAAARSTLKFGFRTDQVGRRIGADQMLVGSILPWVRLVMRPWKTKFGGVSRMSVANFVEVVRLTLPPGWAVAELPPAVHLEHNGTRADIEYSQEPGVVVCERRFVHPAILMDQAEYDAVRLLVDRMEQANRRPIVLKVQPAGG